MQRQEDTSGLTWAWYMRNYACVRHRTDFCGHGITIQSSRYRRYDIRYAISVPVWCRGTLPRRPLPSHFSCLTFSVLEVFGIERNICTSDGWPCQKYSLVVTTFSHSSGVSFSGILKWQLRSVEQLSSAIAQAILKLGRAYHAQHSFRSRASAGKDDRSCCP